MSTRDEIEQLIARVALRDRAAFAALYDATSGKLFAVCLSVLRQRGEAEEALQDVYIRIWHKAGSYAVTGHSPMTWLITLARNLAIDRLRQRRRAGLPIEEAAALPDDSPGPEALAIRSSERDAIAACLGELDANRAEAVRRAYLHGDSYAELASHFDVPLNTMRTWLRRSLQSLRTCLTR